MKLFGRKGFWNFVLLSCFLVIFLVACGETTNQNQQSTAKQTAPTPSPTPDQGQQLLRQVGQTLNSAKTLHGLFNLELTGQNLSGTVASEIWNSGPDKNRTEVKSSTLSQFSTGSITVSDGKQIWQYDPTKKAVYNGSISQAQQAGTGSSGGQSQFILGIVQSVFSQSQGKLVNQKVQVDGHETTQVHVVSNGDTAGVGAPGSGNGLGAGANFQYDGNVYVDNKTKLPDRIHLNIQNFGQVQLDLPRLALNEQLSDTIFSFKAPDGVKVLPLQQAANGNNGNSISLVEAQRQAGYHLLSVPGSETDYQLNGVTVLGAQGNQIFTLNYIKGNQSFTIAEGKSLANLPGGGAAINVRSSAGTFTSNNGINTLSWTEKGVGIKINGNLSQDQMVAIAKILS